MLYRRSFIISPPLPWLCEYFRFATFSRKAIRRCDRTSRPIKKAFFPSTLDHLLCADNFRSMFYTISPKRSKRTHLQSSPSAIIISSRVSNVPLPSFSSPTVRGHAEKRIEHGRMCTRLKRIYA